MRQEENMKSKVGQAALWMSSAVITSLMMVDQAFAGFGSFTPPSSPPSTPPVPEFDGPGAIAAIALLAGFAAVLYQKIKK
jgi:hypothetical protein